MEPRLWSRDFIFSSRFMLQLLPLYCKSICRSKSSQTEGFSIIPNHISSSNDINKQDPTPLPHKELRKRHNRIVRQIVEENNKLNNSGGGNRLFSHLLMTDSQAQAFLKKKKKRHIIDSLLYKTYLGFQDRDLVNTKPQSLRRDLDCQVLNCDEPYLQSEDVTLLGKGNARTDMETEQRVNLDHSPSHSHSHSKPLKQKMCDKYKEPCDNTVEELKRKFPDPDKLFHDVMRPAYDAGLHCHEPLELSSHLKGFYWKAKIGLLWPRKVTVMGKHTDKQNAINRVYLAACAQLMDLGLIIGHQKPSQSVNCDSVVTLLEQISEFGDSTNIDSRGKGFKIVLEKVKKKFDGSYEDLSSNNVNGNVCGEWPRDDSYHNANLSSWRCSVHVGWPIPFSVQMVAPSLPSAQMLALLTAASNLKMFGLLTKSNREINMPVLQQAVLTDITKQWNQIVVQSSQDTTTTTSSSTTTTSSSTTTTTTTTTSNPLQLQHCRGIHGDDVDAKLYVDASNFGYGAYLQLNDSDKVSWLCESWLDQPQVIPKVFLSWNQRLFLHSTVAELYALVSTIFSWKRKLQHRRVVCYNDNQTAVTLMSTANKFSTKPMSTTPSASDHHHHCISLYDSLITSLQQTCHTYNIHLQAAWIQRDGNWLADRLANGDVQIFKAAVPTAAVCKTKVKRLNWKDVRLS